MISGHGNIETAVTAIRQGAYDFIEKPFKADRLVLVAERALETSRLRREVTELKARSVRLEHAGRPFRGAGAVAAADRARGAGQFAHPRSPARRASARSSRPAPSTRRRRGPAARSSSSTPRPSPPKPWRSSCSASRRATGARAKPARWKRRTAARSISTKSPTCRATPRPRFCACWSTRILRASRARRGSMSTCA